MYIELHAASAFSFLEGASLPETLVDRAAQLGYPALALLDRDGVYGAPRFYHAARAAGLKAIVGAELTMTRRRGDEGPEPEGARGAGGGRLKADRGPGAAGAPGRAGPSSAPALWRLPVLVASREGYRTLCRLVTRMKLRAPKGQGALTLDDLEGSTAGLVALAGSAVLSSEGYGVGGLLDRLVGLFGREQVYVELQRHLLRDEEHDNQALLALASAFRVPVVATNGVRFADAADRPVHDVLTCLRHKTTIERAGWRLGRNAERYLKPPAAMARLFADLPQAVAATRELADRVAFTLADLGYRFPDYPVPAGETQASFLRKIVEAGARERYRPYSERARRQIQRELDLIEKLDLAGYFLIVWDIVNFCRRHDILVQGRGSAANSAVCYSLGITAVDPVGMDLLFERFLSEERGEWPDIDLDLPSGPRRERVIQYVYERYGPLGAGMTANVITYRGRSAAREVGKVLGLDLERLDRVAKLLDAFEWIDPRDTLDRYLVEAGFDRADGRVRLFADLWQRFQHLPRHLGQHAGGMVICQGRLDEVVPLEPATMPGRVVIQWDKDDCADLGIVKVDLLGLGMMAVLQDALALVNRAGAAVPAEARGARASAAAPDESDPTAGTAAPRAEDGDRSDSAVPPDAAGSRPTDQGSGPVWLDLAHLPPDDPVVYRMLQEADTIGVFQVESRAQMATLPRLRPRCFYDLVVQVAIIRPGPIVGQMVHPYLKRRAGLEPVTYPHPSLAPILERTLGVPLFQEQLLRMAMVAAGFSGGEAEELRRTFGFKRSVERMRRIEERLRAGMAQRGITGEAAEEIVRAITSFALYGFPESHAASFALLVYASAYLKAHFPAAFYTAVLNNQPMGFYHPATLVKDAQRHGVRFRPIDVQRSCWQCTIEADGAIRLGLCYVTGLREEVGRAIEAAGLAPGGAAPPPPSGPRAPGCPKCGCDDPSMLDLIVTNGQRRRFCRTCAHDWGDAEPAATAAEPAGQAARFRSLEDFIARTGVRRDELATLAEIGALNAFGYDRRTALWQIERAVRPAGALFAEEAGTAAAGDEGQLEDGLAAPGAVARDAAEGGDAGWDRMGEPPAATGWRARQVGVEALLGDRAGDRPQSGAPRPGPLAPMSPVERMLADYAGTGLTLGPHPMAFRRAELAVRGVLRAKDLALTRHGRRVRVAGVVITRQRPGTAKGFVFLTLEDETGLANIVVRPDLFAARRAVVVGEPFLLVEGVLERHQGVTAIRAERIEPLAAAGPVVASHDFR